MRLQHLYCFFVCTAYLVWFNGACLKKSSNLTSTSPKTIQKQSCSTSMYLMIMVARRHQQQVDLWPFDLKMVSESRVTWATSELILIFLGLSVLDLGPMYATDRQTSDRRQTKSSLKCLRLMERRHNNFPTIRHGKWREIHARRLSGRVQ